MALCLINGVLYRLQTAFCVVFTVMVIARILETLSPITAFILKKLTKKPPKSSRKPRPLLELAIIDVTVTR